MRNELYLPYTNVTTLATITRYSPTYTRQKPHKKGCHLALTNPHF